MRITTTVKENQLRILIQTRSLDICNKIKNSVFYTEEMEFITKKALMDIRYDEQVLFSETAESIQAKSKLREPNVNLYYSISECKENPSKITKLIKFLNTIDFFEGETKENILIKLSKYVGLGIYTKKMVIKELNKIAKINPQLLLTRAEEFAKDGFKGAFITAAALLEERKHFDLALELLEKVPLTHPEFVDAKYMQANIMMCEESDLLGAFEALNNAGNSELIVALRSRILGDLVGGSGFDDTLPCKAEISGNTLLSYALEIAKLKQNVNHDENHDLIFQFDP